MTSSHFLCHSPIFHPSPNIIENRSLSSFRSHGSSFFDSKSRNQRTPFVRLMVSARKQVEVVLQSQFFVMLQFQIGLSWVFVVSMFLFHWAFNSLYINACLIVKFWVAWWLDSVQSWWKDKQAGRWGGQGSRSGFKAHSILTLQGKSLWCFFLHFLATGFSNVLNLANLSCADKCFLENN